MRRSLCGKCFLRAVICIPCWICPGACLPVQGLKPLCCSLGVKTVVLFFEKGKPTKKVWFYQLNLDRNLGKTNPLNENDLAEFVKLQKTKADSENSWSVNVADLDKTTFDLSVKNPHKKDETALRDPKEILDEMKEMDKESADILKAIKALV